MRLSCRNGVPVEDLSRMALWRSWRLFPAHSRLELLADGATFAALLEAAPPRLAGVAHAASMGRALAQV
eukprot:2167292-Pleurochrysis_carterae.AAC.1